MELQQREVEESTPLVMTAPKEARRPVSEILKDLGSQDRKARAAAETELARLGPASSDELLAALEEEGRKNRQRQRIAKRTMYGFVTFFLLYLTVGIVIGLSAGSWEILKHFGSLCGMFGALGAATAISPQFKSIATVMATLDDVRSVGWLVDAMSTQDKQVQVSAESALVRLLPKLGGTDHDLLDDEQRRKLDRLLLKSANRDLATAILGAYEKIGDSKSLDSVRQYAQGHGASPFDPYMRRVAMQVEDAIRARAEKEHQARTLLRAAADSNGDVLLRPAAGTTTDEEALLRPTEA